MIELSQQEYLYVGVHLAAIMILIILTLSAGVDDDDNEL